MKNINKLNNLIQSNRNKKTQLSVINKSDSVTEIYVYDVIDSYWGVNAEDFVKAINGIQTDEIVIRINSPGGDAFDGRAMASAIKAHSSVITAKIDGLCASAATTIANACGAIEMAEGSFYMIHNAWTFAYGNKNDLADTVRFLEKIDDAIANDYAKRTGIEVDDIKAMMDDETWMTSEEALEKGFVTSVIDSETAENTFDLSAFNKAPKMPDNPEKPVLQQRSKYARMANVAKAISSK